MKNPTKRASKEQEWRHRVQRAAHRSGTILEFCKAEGISREALRYWQRKATPKRALGPASPFARVEVIERVEPSTCRRSVPDPRWVAELIRYLHDQGEGR
jgi:hypothetical protein